MPQRLPGPGFPCGSTSTPGAINLLHTNPVINIYVTSVSCPLGLSPHAGASFPARGNVCPDVAQAIPAGRPVHCPVSDRELGRMPCRSLPGRPGTPRRTRARSSGRQPPAVPGSGRPTPTNVSLKKCCRYDFAPERREADSMAIRACRRGASRALGPRGARARRSPAPTTAPRPARVPPCIDGIFALSLTGPVVGAYADAPAACAPDPHAPTRPPGRYPAARSTRHPAP